MTRVVGIVLVRDEDVFVECAVRNVTTFCDEILLVDHRSRDDTPAILARLADELPHATMHSVREPAESHDLIKGYAGERVWVFGVDGDELYDPRGLRQVRERLFEGEFDGWWFVKGNVLHCDELEIDRARAAGWLAPPSRSTTKLFNFAAIDSWDGSAQQRLHGGTPVFRPGYCWDKTCWLRDEYDWDRSPLRCLHACFLPRSTRQTQRIEARPNIGDRRSVTRSARAGRQLRKLAGRPEQSSWKLDRYRQGEHVQVDVEGFFSH